MISYIYFLNELLPYTTGAYNTIYYGLYAGNMLYSAYKFINNVRPIRKNIIYNIVLENTNIDIERSQKNKNTNKKSENKNKNTNKNTNKKTENKNKNKKTKLVDKYTAEQICNLYKISNDNSDIDEIVELKQKEEDSGFVNYDFQITTKEEITRLTKHEKKVLLNNWSKIDII